MKRKIAIVGTFWLVILACLILIAANPFRPAEPNLDFSEGCLRGYLWDARIQHIACGLSGEDGAVVPGPDKRDGGKRTDPKLPDDIVPPPATPVPPVVVPPTPTPKPPVVVPPTTTPPDAPEIVPPTSKPPDDPKPPVQNDDDKKCPKQDNRNKQDHHNCGKGPGPGEHDNGNGGGNKDKSHGQDKGKGKNK